MENNFCRTVPYNGLKRIRIDRLSQLRNQLMASLKGIVIMSHMHEAIHSVVARLQELDGRNYKIAVIGDLPVPHGTTNSSVMPITAIKELSEAISKLKPAAYHLEEKKSQHWQKRRNQRKPYF